MLQILVALVVLVGTYGAAAGAAPADAAQSRGEKIYSGLCAACHGRYGRGDGPLAENLSRKPPDFTDSNWFAGRSDAVIASALTETSHGPMAVANVLKPEALRDALAYIRTLSVPGKHVSVPAGRDIYKTSCSPCHGVNGDGNGPAARFLPGNKPRNFTSATFVIEGREDAVVQFISTGAEAATHGSPYMPEWASRLSQQQIRDTVEYLKTFKKSRR